MGGDMPQLGNSNFDGRIDISNFGKEIVVAGGASYADKVLGYSPFAYYRMNELSGTDMIDSSGNGHDGSYTGVTLNSSVGFDGEPVPLYDGINDFADYYSNGLRDSFSVNECTMMVWAKNVGAWDYYATIFEAGSHSSTPRAHINKSNQSSGGWEYWVRPTNEIVYREIVADPSDWVQLAIVLSVTAGTAKLFYEGSLVSTLTGYGGVGLINATYSKIGGSLGNFFSGYLSHVSFLPVLNDAAIADLAVV